MNIQNISSWAKFLIQKFGINGLKGLYAEKVVSGYLRVFFPRSTVMSNITLPYGNYTTQIDHILINEYGIFVIEVKNYKGFITATQQHDKWFIKYATHHNAKSYRINSPLHQNITHCKAVASYLRLPHSTPINVVSFTKRAKVRVAKGEYLPNICVGTDLIKYLKSFKKKQFTTDQVEEFTQRLWANRLPSSLSTDFYHVKNIKQMIADREATRLESVQQEIREINHNVHQRVPSGTKKHNQNEYEKTKLILKNRSKIKEPNTHA